jgi:DNA recombination protein RmuC
MPNEFYLLAALIIGAIALAVFLINKKLSQIEEKSKPDETLMEWLKTQQRDSQETSKQINERLDRAARVISGVQKSIGEMSEIGRGMRDLQEFLRSPKLRGNIGEQVLKELLGQMLPKQAFNLQYSFKSGAKVDAAIKTGAGIIPVDAKFPMENFRKMTAAETEAEKKTHEKAFVKDVKKHIDDIAAKYILTDEGTIDYALMYLPSEAVYYEVVNNSTLFDYSGKKRVLPVSPMTFYAYLRAILMSFEGQKIEAKARQILSSLRAIQRDYNKMGDNLSVLSKHIQNSYNQMSNVLSGFTLLGQKLSSTQALGEGTKEEIEQLEIKEK